jgi:hypothetical protein
MDPSLIPASLNREGLEILSAATGGRSFDGSDLSASFAQARTDGQSSYLVEYSPTQTGKPTGDCRNVRISTDRKGVRLLTQQLCLAQR